MTDQIMVTSDGSILEDIDLAPETVADEVIQNIAVILATVKNTVPYMYGFGINGQIKGRPLPIVQNIIVSETFEQIKKYEPRAKIGNIEVTADEDDATKVTISVALEGVEENGDEFSGD